MGHVEAALDDYMGSGGSVQKPARTEALICLTTPCFATYHTIPYYVILDDTVLYYTVLCFAVLYCTVV